jgi:CheY-like chemotaxis protein
METGSGLPSAASEKGPFPQPPPDAGGEKKVGAQRERGSFWPTVLLIEDNAADVYVISRALNECGIPIDLKVFTDGEEVWSVLQDAEARGGRQIPSLILLDWNLPKVSGAEILSFLYRSTLLRDIPVVVITSTNSPEEVRQIKKFGAVHFRKPNDLDAYLDLKTIVLQVLLKPPQEPA